MAWAEVDTEATAPVAEVAPLTTEAPAPQRQIPLYFESASQIDDAGTLLVGSIPLEASKRLEAGGEYVAPGVRWPTADDQFTVLSVVVSNLEFEPGYGTEVIIGHDCALRSRTSQGEKEVLRWSHMVEYNDVDCELPVYRLHGGNVVAVRNDSGGDGGESWVSFHFREFELDPEGHVKQRREWSGNPFEGQRPEWVVNAAKTDAEGRALRALRAEWLGQYEYAMQDLKALKVPASVLRGLRSKAAPVRFDAEKAGPFEFGMTIDAMRGRCSQWDGEWDQGRTLVGCKIGDVSFGAGLCQSRACTLVSMWGRGAGPTFEQISRDIGRKYGRGTPSKRGAARVKTWNVDTSRTIELTEANMMGRQLISWSLKRDGG